jgi:hypothetical protein
MLPPEPVMANVDYFSWNATGTKLAIVTRPREIETQAALQDLSKNVGRTGPRFVGLVDARTLKTTWVTGVEIGDHDASVQWPSGAEFCLLSIGWQEEGERPDEPIYYLQHYIVDPGTGKAQMLGEGIDVWMEPLNKGRHLMTIVQPDGETVKTAVVDASGKVGPTLPGLEKAMLDQWLFSEWSDKYGVILSRKRELMVLLPDGNLQPLDWTTYMAERRALVQRQQAEAELELDERQSLQGRELWLVARPDMGVQPAAMVCSVTEFSELSPAKNGVAYTSQRMLWLRRMVFMDGEKYALMRREAVKADAIDVA